MTRLAGEQPKEDQGRVSNPLTIAYRNYGLESPRLLKRGMKSRSLFGAWGWVGLAHFSVIRGIVAQGIVGWSHRWHCLLWREKRNGNLATDQRKMVPEIAHAPAR